MLNKENQCVCMCVWYWTGNLMRHVRLIDSNKKCEFGATIYKAKSGNFLFLLYTFAVDDKPKRLVNLWCKNYA